jgi:hypothetical protein
MQIISRKQAFMDAKTRFYTGRACSNGHDVERYTSTGGCVVCANASHRSWKILRGSAISENNPRAQPILIEIPFGVTGEQQADFVKWVQHVAAPHYFKSLGLVYGPPKSVLTVKSPR